MKILGYDVVFDRELDGRYIASVPAVPGCHVYGWGREEALSRVQEILKFHLEQQARKKAST